MTSLAEQQAALVAAITGTAPVPDGFDTARLEVARKALLRKRSGEVSQRWPLLAEALGERFTMTFVSWAAHRPTNGALADGWVFARELAAAGELSDAARWELAEREAAWVLRGTQVRRRVWPSVQAVPGGWVFGWRGRSWSRFR